MPGGQDALSAPCLPTTSRLLEAGRDQKGYYVRARPWNGDRSVPARVRVSPVVDTLAAAAGATAFYFGNSLTEKPLGAQEWPADTPLAAVRDFATSAGLVVETPAPDFWLIGPPWINERAALLVTTRAIEKARDALPLGQSIELGKALVAQLPVRTDLSGQREVSLIDVAYHFLSEEGRDVLLAVVTIPAVLPPQPPRVKAFKVKLNRSGGRLQVQCLWSVSGLEGPLITEIKEDFDGDGFRDFIFSSVSSDNPTTSIISGRTGDELLGFSSWPLAVERKASGPKRVAVGFFKEGPVPAGEPTEVAEVLAFDPKVSRFVTMPIKREAVRTRGGEERHDVNSGWQMLAQVVGGVQNVVVYGGGPPNKVKNVAESRLRRSVEYRFIGNEGWPLNPTAEDIAKGYPAQILYSWESEGFRKERERREGKVPR
jgi:hypothetical protein